MKNALLLLFILLSLTCCITLREAQSGCESKYTAFTDIVACTNQAFANDPRATDNANLKFYLMRGNQLAQMVKSDRISNYDAKVEWQADYLNYRNQAAIDDRRIAAALNAAAAMSAPTRTGASPSLGGASYKPGLTCLYKSQWNSGFNKNCVYDCVGSQAVETISNTDICPPSIRK